MSSMTTFTCPECKTTQSLRSDKSLVFICTTCGSLLRDETSLDLPKRPIPADWSVVQIGSTGSFKGKAFEVIGRVRLQLQKEYKNYWSIWYAQTKEYGWLVESLGFYAICPGNFFEIKDSDRLKGIVPHESFHISDKATIILDDEDYCESLAYTGELPTWSFYAPRFRIVQGNSDKVIASFFHVSVIRELALFLVGEWVSWKSLELKNLNTEHEW